jgi:HAE1 family hydrophobic/amphiphilic exporter-1
LSELAVAKRSVTLLLVVALFIAGLSAWNSLQQELLPDIEFPVITVIAPYPGAGAADVAEQVAKPIERAISGIPRLESLRSTSSNSIALVVAQFSFGTDVKETTAAINENLLRAGLPSSVEAQVTALNINASPVVVASISATSEDGLEAAASVARTEIASEIQAIEGVASADLTGGLEQQVIVTLDPAKLQAANIGSQQVIGLLQANNLTLPAGQLTTEGTKIPVSTIGRFDTVEAIEGLVVGFRLPTAIPGASPAAVPSVVPAQPTPITLADIATVELADVATTGYARTGTPETGANPSLTLTVTKTSAANTVQVAEAVDAKINEIAARHTDVLTVAVVSDLSTFIKESQDGLVREGGLGALFAILTIFLFLASIRATAVAAISIPLSVLTALVVMQLLGMSLNIMTLAGLAVAVGRVVDDAIVVLENIYRHREMGEDRLTAVTRGPREVASAITASTLTTVAVFLPLGFVGGLVTQFFLPFSLTVTFALLASLICALTVVPVLAYLFIDRVKLAVDEDGEPCTRRGCGSTCRRSPSPCAAARTKWGVLASRGAVRGVADARQQPAHRVHQRRLGEDPPGRDRPAEGSHVRGGLEAGHRGRDHRARARRCRARPDERPGEGDIGSTRSLAAFQGRPANSAIVTVRYDPAVDLDEKTTEQRTRSSASRPTATTSVNEVPASPPTASA